MQDLLQILQLFTASNPSEAFLGPKQRGGGPAQNHAWAVPAFDAAGPVGGLGKTVLDQVGVGQSPAQRMTKDRKSTRLNSSHLVISYAVFCLKKKKKYK